MISPPPLPSQQAQQINTSLSSPLVLLSEPNKLSAGAAVDWIKEAWGLFKGNVGIWIGASVLFIVLSCIPWVGALAQLAMIFFIAGITYMAHLQATGQRVEFSQLFIGFQKNSGQLLLLILINFIIAILVVIALFILIFSFGLAGSSASVALGRGQIPLSFWLMFLGGLLIFIPYAMALWLAPALIILNDMNAIDALKLSLKACLKNMGAFFVFGLLNFIMFIVGLIPFGLGLFIAVPVFMLTYYTSYRSMLTKHF